MSEKVYLVDDDQSVREALVFLLQSVGIECVCFPSADEFISAYDDSMSGCLLLDIRMPGMCGLDLQQRLQRMRSPLPVIILTGHGDISLTKRAMKAGAIDFLEKPFNDQQLLESIRNALAIESSQRGRHLSRQAAQIRLDRLSEREREVLDLFVAGQQTKQVAKSLHISEKTVAAHRSRLYEKLRVDNVVEMVHLAAHVDAFVPQALRSDTPSHHFAGSNH